MYQTALKEINKMASFHLSIVYCWTLKQIWIYSGLHDILQKQAGVSVASLSKKISPF